MSKHFRYDRSGNLESGLFFTFVYEHIARFDQPGSWPVTVRSSDRAPKGTFDLGGDNSSQSVELFRCEGNPQCHTSYGEVGLPGLLQGSYLDTPLGSYIDFEDRVWPAEYSRAIIEPDFVLHERGFREFTSQGFLGYSAWPVQIYSGSIDDDTSLAPPEPDFARVYDDVFFGIAGLNGSMFTKKVLIGGDESPLKCPHCEARIEICTQCGMPVGPLTCQQCDKRRLYSYFSDREVDGRWEPFDFKMLTKEDVYVIDSDVPVIDGKRWLGQDVISYRSKAGWGHILSRRVVSFLSKHDFGPFEFTDVHIRIDRLTDTQRRYLKNIETAEL